ncbi:MAG: 7-cyano-7-deazaguanine synthase QueC [Thermoplasmata archaeon]|nr:7-cyano-7-deazaguanine synthase QueC [Thermoplasmata archaeon]
MERAVGQPSAVVLLSGGLDSATCLAIASKDFEVYALTFDYGSRHSREITRAKSLAAHYEVKNHTIMKIELNAISGSSLTDFDIPVEHKPINEIGKSIPSSYVPARNLTFLSLGIALAEVVGARKVFIGVNSVDYSGYPDCRPEFIAAFQKAAAVGTRAGAEGKPIAIETPLLHLSKADIIKKGHSLGVPFEMTWSCYTGEKKPCGKCESCRLRLEGFREAGMVDPVEYQH